MSTGAKHGRLHQRGFTLLELMIVIVLIGILTAVILPEMKGTYEHALLRATGRKLVSALTLASSRAIALNQLHRVRLEPGDGQYFVERRANEAEAGRIFVLTDDSTTSHGDLDRRITVEVRPGGDEPSEPVPDQPASARDGAPNQTAANAIQFYPDGTADGGEILLKDRDGFRLALRINPITARVHVVETGQE